MNKDPYEDESEEQPTTNCKFFLLFSGVERLDAGTEKRYPPTEREVHEGFEEEGVGVEEGEGGGDDAEEEGGEGAGEAEGVGGVRIDV